MVNKPVFSGEVLRDCEWELVKTPNEWWWDYKHAHPEFEPWSITDSEFERIYRVPRRLVPSAAEYASETGLAKPEDEDYCAELYYDHFFMNSYFGNDFKYLLKLKGSKTGYDRQLYHDYYDPTANAQNAYLYFCRLSNLAKKGWSPQRVMSQVKRFADKYGPPWYPELRLLYTPPFRNRPPEAPLSVDLILWESLKMSQTLNAYRLLRDFASDGTTIKKLLQHMKDVQRSQAKLEPIVYQDMWEGRFDRKKHDLETDAAVTDAARYLVTTRVTEGLHGSGIEIGLTSFQGNKQSVATWLPKYEFHSLIGAMWLQLHTEILKNTALRECANENCGRLFVPSRANQDYCSKSCGVSQYMRDRRKGGT